MRYRVGFRVLAAYLAVSMLYMDFAWALDVRQAIIDAKKAFDEMDEGRKYSGMGVNRFQETQASQEAEVASQTALQELESLNFSLTTPNGDIIRYIGSKIDRIERPDGTLVRNIQLDAAGNIAGADLRLADGSIQILDGGKILGYRTPNGTLIEYDAPTGRVTKTTSLAGVVTLYSYINDAAGNLAEIVLDSPASQSRYDADGAIKESLSKSDGRRTYFTNGMIQKIVEANGDEVLFESEAVGDDTVVRPQETPSLFVDGNGNRYLFEGGEVASVTLPDGAVLDAIVWALDGTVKDAVLTETGGTRHDYADKRLVRSVDPEGVATDYSYTADRIWAVSQGTTYEYLLDGTLVRLINADGTWSSYYTGGVYKGLKSDDGNAAGGVAHYEYLTLADGSIRAKRRDYVLSVYNITLYDGLANLAQSTNPTLKFTAKFTPDAGIDPSIEATATGGGKTLKLKLLAGAGSTTTFGGVTSSLGVTLEQNVSYTGEIRWETGQVGIYVYRSSDPRPSTPTKTVSDRAWDPKFKLQSVNAEALRDSSSSGYYNKNVTLREKNSAFVGGSPVHLISFRQRNTSYRPVDFKATQSQNGVTRENRFYLNSSGVWSATTKDNGTTVASLSFSKTLEVDKDYFAEIRVEGGKTDLYIWEKGAERPALPVASLAAFSSSVKFYGNFANATATGVELKNLAESAVSSAHQARTLSPRAGFLGTTTVQKPAAPPPERSEFKSITYDAQSRLKEVLKADGTRIVFEAGLPKEVFDPSGGSVSLAFAESALGNLVQSSITQNGLKSTYDAEGRLATLELDDLAIHYKDGADTIEWIEKDDGTELWDLVFGEGGEILGASIYDPEGNISIYENGALKNYVSADQVHYSFFDGKIDTIMTPESFVYHLSYTPEAIMADLDSSIVPDAFTAVQMEYDTGMNLRKLVRENQEILNFFDNELVRIEAPDGAVQEYSYEKDAAGKILSTTVRQGNVTTLYDAFGQALTSTVAPDAENPHALEVIYQYGKIRHIKKDGVLTLVYSYSFKPDGTEVTSIDDLEEHSTKIYEKGLLLTSFDTSNSVLSSYSYEAISGRVKRVEVTRFGRVLHSYDYAYSGDNTLVTDEEGIVRTYSAGQKLTFLDRDGARYAYSYAAGEGGKEIVREELTERTLSDGSFVRYDKGQVSSVDLPDGSRVTDVVLDEAGGFKQATVTLPSGIKKIFDGVGVLQEILADGTQLYYESGKLAKYAFPNGSEVIFDYEVGGTKVRVGDLLFHYNAAEILVGFTSSAGDYYALNALDASASPATQIAQALSQAVGTESAALDANAIVQAAEAAERARQEASRSRKVNLSVNAGYMAVPPFEFTSDFITSHGGGLPGNTTGWRFEYSGQWRPIHVTEPHGVWFYTGPSTGSPKVFVTLNQLAGFEEIPYSDLYIPPTETFGSIVATSGTIATSFTTRSFTFGTVWQKMPRELLWRWGTPTTSHPYLTQKQWLYISSHLGSIRTGYCDGGWGIACSQKMEYMLPQNMRAYGPVVTSSNPAYYFGYVVEEEAIARIDAHLAELTSLAQAITARRNALTARRQTLLDSPSFLETHVGVAAIPFKARLNDTTSADERSFWYSTSREALLPKGEVWSQEYSAEGILETQSHADGTVTLFDGQNRPSQVLDDRGNLLIEYFYDASGNLERVNLKNARETLPEEMIRAKAGIEEGRQKELLRLAEAKSLAVADIKAQADVARAQLQGQINYIQGEIQNLENQNVRGSQAKRAKSAALDQARGVAGSVWSQWSELHRVEADAYAGLDLQIKALSDEIKADAQTAFEALDVQEKALKREILRQEVSPVIYDRYRRVLGRDPSSVEYDAWLAKMDYETGEVIVHEETLVTIDPGASLQFDGSDDYLTLPDSDDWYFGQADFTIELNVKFNAFTQAQRGFVEQSDWGDNGWKFFYHNSAGLFFTLNGNTVIIQRPWSPVVGQWYHVALTRSGNAWRLFVNGAQLGDAVTNSIAMPNYTQSLALGAMHDGSIRYYLNGWMDGLRISTNARYTSNFTPSQYRQTPDAKTVLLLEVDRASGTVADRSAAARPVTRLGAIATSTAQYKLSKRTETRIVQKAALTDTLDDHLLALPELAERQAYVASIKSQVKTLIQNYLAMTDAEKTAFASSLGLASGDLIPLSEADADKIIVWLDSRSLHFGQSAFLSLESLLDQKGIAYNREELATKAILVDIFSGVISPLDDGDLVISVFALDKVASLYGLSLSAANLSWEDLENIFNNAADVLARLVYSLDQEYGFSKDSGGYYQNWGGLGEKWFLGKPHEGGNNWYYITPDGKIYAWSGQSAISMRQNGTSADRFIAETSPEYYLNPAVLHDALVPSPKQIIAHINGNHYVIITNVTADSITYIDPGIGKDKENESVTVAKEGFLKVWKGNVTAGAAALSAAQEREGSQARILSASEAKDIRGAFWGSVLGMIGSILTWVPGLNVIGLTLSAISAVISAIEGDWISAISSVVTLGLGGFGDFFKAAFQGVVQAMGPIGQAFMAVGTFAQKIYNGVVGFFNTAISFLPGIGPALLSAAAAQGMNIGAQIVNMALSTGISMGVSKGLEIIGVNPQIAAYAGSLVSGFIIGGLSKTAVNQSGVALTRTQQIRSVVMDQVLINNIGRLGAELNLDPMFTQLIGLSLGAIQGTIIQNPGTTLEQAFKNVLPNLSQGLSLYGIQKLGNTIGLDPRISGAIGLSIGGAISRSFDAGKLIGEDIVRSVLDGLTGSAIQIGLDFAISELDIDDPLLEALTSAVITQSIASFLDPNGNIIDNMLEKAGQFAVEFLGDISSSDFYRQMSDYGLSSALESYAAAIFSRQALEEIHAAGGIAQVISGRAELVDYNGVTLTKVNITGSEGFVLDEYGKFAGTFRVSDGVLEESFGQFDVSTGSARLVNGTVRQVFSNGEVSYIQVKNGTAYRLVLKMPGSDGALGDATVQYVPCPEVETGCVNFDLKEGQANEPVWSWEVVENYQGELSVNGFNLTDGLFFINGEVAFEISDDYGRAITYDTPDQLVSSLTYPEDLDYLLLNGISFKEVPEGTPPPYFDPSIENSFVGSLANENVSRDKVGYVALYEDAHFYSHTVTAYILKKDPREYPESLGDIGFDALTVWMSQFFDTKEVKDVRAAFDQMFVNGEDHLVPLAYSGGGQPLVTALNTTVDGLTKYSFIDTVIFVGSPVFSPITNPHVKTVINIYGSQDELEIALTEGYIDPKLLSSNDFAGGRTDLKQYNIVLEGLHHTDYFFNPAEHAQKAQELEGLKAERLALLEDPLSTATEIAEIEDKIDAIERVFYADAFVARLTAAAENEVRLQAFIQDLPAPIDGVYKFNPKDVINESIDELLQRKELQ